MNHLVRIYNDRQKLFDDWDKLRDDTVLLQFYCHAAGAELSEESARAHWLTRPKNPPAWTTNTSAQCISFSDAGGFGEERMPRDWEQQLEHPNRPVVSVTWYEASAYCAWAGGRLLTGQEWEGAARGREGREYPWGAAEPDETRANYLENGPKHPTPVGLYPAGATPEGILDLAGNVWEWLDDWSDDKRQYRVLRGGSWLNVSSSLRAAFRSGGLPGLSYACFGYLSRTPGALSALLRDLPEAWTHRNEGEGTWTVQDVVGHLIYGEQTDWMPRARLILEHGENQAFEPFDMMGHIQVCEGKSLDGLVDEFARLRAANLADLQALGLLPSDLALRGHHPALGLVTLSELLATWAAHDLTHLHQLSRILAHQYREAVGPWAAYLGVMRCTGHSSV